jgi:hypothetical protein
MSIVDWLTPELVQELAKLVVAAILALSGKGLVDRRRRRAETRHVEAQTSLTEAQVRDLLTKELDGVYRRLNLAETRVLELQLSNRRLRQQVQHLEHELEECRKLRGRIA